MLGNAAAEWTGTVLNKDRQFPDVVLWSMDGKKHTKMLNGDKVTIIEEIDDQYKVRWNDQVGVVKQWHIQATPVMPTVVPTASERIGTVLNKDQHPDVVLWRLDGRTHTKMLNGDKVIIIDEINDQYKVRWNGEEGLVKQWHIQATPVMATSSERIGTVLNKDQYPDVVLRSLDGKTRSKMLNGDKVTIIDEIDDQYKVWWNGQVGLVKQWHIQAKTLDTSSASTARQLSKVSTSEINVSMKASIFGTWTYREHDDHGAYKISNESGRIIFKETALATATWAELVQGPDWLEGELWLEGARVGRIRLRLEGNCMRSNVMATGAKNWQPDIIASPLETPMCHNKNDNDGNRNVDDDDNPSNNVDRDDRSNNDSDYDKHTYDNHN